MLNKENRHRCTKVIDVYPKQHQMLMLMEELAELVQATSKYLRYGETEPFLEEYADSTQFIVVTHRKGTMEAVDTLYGVTIEDAGVSKILSVKLDEIEE